MLTVQAEVKRQASGLDLYTHRYPSPVGDLHIAVDRNGRLHYLSYVPLEPQLPQYLFSDNKYACGEIAYQLDEYFQGKRHRFDIECVFSGTSFQEDVWNRLLKIPYGSTLSYGELARKIGRRDAYRAVGTAVGLNPISIVMPCHRVLPASGGMGNYALSTLGEKGAKIKEYLLRLEDAV